ncbi:uncharacterized protein LOC135529412, partial [Oncorhynchus masou masou]|uniref:uncharacterized protein LOC135529412 n=1 Tax=Oncorhynchus masou masou TaxID=90313 RepID=UPI0031836615
MAEEAQGLFLVTAKMWWRFSSHGIIQVGATCSAMEDQYLWRSGSYGGPVPIEERVLWRSWSYGGPVPMDDQYLWRSGSYGGPVPMEERVLWMTSTYGGAGPMEDPYLWRSGSYGGPGPMEDRVLWRTSTYGGAGPMEERVLWRTSTYGGAGLLNGRSLTSKANIVRELITDHNLDVIGLTETWLKPDEFTVLNEASPPGYTSDHIPRASRKGGGVANIYDSKFQFPKTKMTFSSFELLVMKSMQPFIATVYRPPEPYTAFLIEFPEFLSDLVVIADNILIFGDFNIHMEKSTDPLQKAFGAIIDFVQHVSGPTHCHSHTLDLVLSHGINVVDLNVFPHNPGLSDHHFI